MCAHDAMCVKLELRVVQMLSISSFFRASALCEEFSIACDALLRQISIAILWLQAVSMNATPPPKDNTPSQMDILALRTARPAQPQETLPLTRSIQELKGFKVTPEDHRNYALTWYTLSAATGAMAYGIVKKRKPAF